MFGNKFSWSFFQGARPFTITAANQLPNLNLWYNASASTTLVNNVSTNNFNVSVSNGTAIGTWTDLTGLAQDANVNGGAGLKPTYATSIQNSLGAVQYTSANKSNLDINPTAWAQSLSGMTIYVVARPTNLPATVFPLVNTGGTNTGIWWNGTNWSIGQSNGNYGTVTVTDDTSKFHVYGWIFDGTQTNANAALQNQARLRFRYDRAQQSLTFTGTIGSNTGLINYFFFGGNNRNVGLTQGTYMSGYIGEVLIWTRTLTSVEILTVETYIANKWAI